MTGEVKQQTPRAMIHKRIIDAAAARPNAALAEIAADVSGASTDLVERVLDEYGDPADETASTPPTTSTAPDQQTAIDALRAEADTAADDSDSDATDTTEPARDDTPPTVTVDLDALSAKRRETLRAINAYPDASQRELGALLGVAAATISQRVSGIEGFDWTDRADFVAGLFEETREEFDAAFDLETPDPEPDAPPTDQAPATTADSPPADGHQPTRTAVSDGGRTDPDPEVRALQDRIAALEAALADRDTNPSRLDPALISKAMHACLDADTIDREEEHRLIQYFLT